MSYNRDRMEIMSFKYFEGDDKLDKAISYMINKEIEFLSKGKYETHKFETQIRMAIPRDDFPSDYISIVTIETPY